MIDPSLRAVLRSRYSIRRFFAFFGLLLVALLILLLVITTYAPLGAFRDASATLLSDFSATVAIFITIYVFYVLVTSPELRNAEVIPLRDVEISDQIIDLPAVASDYWLWGRSGSYFRTAVLPRLDDLARRERKHVRMRIVLPDPDREGNGALYKQFKRGLDEQADDTTLAANVIATIVSVVAACSRNPYLKAEIGLCATVPVLRYDLSNSGALITRDAKKLPAILTNSGNPYFEMFKDAVENELAQSKKVRWNGVALEDFEAGQVLSDHVMAAIDGLPRRDAPVLEETRLILQSKSNRYAR
jgi:hypothetical protein